MKGANPYLSFDGNTEEAFNYYRSVFGGNFAALVRFRDFGDGQTIPEQDLDKVAHVSLPLGRNTVLMATDQINGTPVEFRPGTNCSITIETESDEETYRLFAELSLGGRILLPLTRTEWAEKYGMCVDRFGVCWMVNYQGDVRLRDVPDA